MAENTSNPTKARPLSPHLSIWRWHITMATSILHRVTGAANAAALLVLLLWLLAISAGPDAYSTFQNLIGSLLGKLVLFGILVSVSYHIANGVRHLAFNLGLGLDKKTANITGWLVIVLGVLGAIKLMFLGYLALGR